MSRKEHVDIYHSQWNSPDFKRGICSIPFPERLTLSIFLLNMKGLLTVCACDLKCHKTFLELHSEVYLLLLVQSPHEPVHSVTDSAAFTMESKQFENDDLFPTNDLNLAY